MASDGAQIADSVLQIPDSVLEAYGLERAKLRATEIPSLINATYVLTNSGPEGPDRLVLQRLHPVFGPHVHFDIAAVTEHLASRQLETPRLIQTRRGELWTVESSHPELRVWRAMTYVDGQTVHRAPDVSWLASAAALLGRFHHALADFNYEFLHQRPIHDTSRHIIHLEDALRSERGQSDREASELGAEILRHAEDLRLDFTGFPRRILHGDPKLSNVMFHREPAGKARCMIDLDTLGYGPLAHELGDALRSWCNPAGEDVATARVDRQAFSTLIAGYASACPRDVNDAELFSALDGLETISLELASRFAADAIADKYFGWDPTRFATRREHNLLRARGQLALSSSVRADRGALSALLENINAERARS